MSSLISVLKLQGQQMRTKQCETNTLLTHFTVAEAFVLTAVL